MKTVFEKKFGKAFLSQILEKHHTRKTLHKPCFEDYFYPYFIGIEQWQMSRIKKHQENTNSIKFTGEK